MGRKQPLKNVNSESQSYDAEEYRVQIERLKSELAKAQRTIIEMTSVVGVQQTFPTVQETIQQYRGIRDQKHHDTSTLLKKWVKRECGNKWMKFYINQVVHQLMFEVLLRCHCTVTKYRKDIYDVIADQLNMKKAIADALQIGHRDDD